MAAPTTASVRALAEDLRSSSGEARAAAIEALAKLPASALPAIAARFREMRSEPLRDEDGYEIWRAFAHAVGSNNASDPVDVVPGIAPVLEEGVTQARARMAERLLLLRSLERIGSAPAMVMALELFAFAFEAFRWEARHMVSRVGTPAAAALLRASNERGSLGVWGRWGLRALAIEGPAQMVQGQDEEGIVEVVRAYAAIRHMGGMPMVADYVDDPRRPIREAAREAMVSYGQNGIWQLRRVMKQQLGMEANLDWSWQRTMRSLYEALDARRLEPMNAALDGALAEAAAGRTEKAVAALERILERSPDLPRRGEMAPIFATLGDAQLEGARFDEALRAYDRALWLDGSHPDVERWRASRALAIAERSIALGAPDEPSLRAALASPVAGSRAEERLGGDAAPQPVRAPESASSLEPAPLAMLGATLLLWPWLALLGRWLGAHAWRVKKSLRALRRWSVVAFTQLRARVVIRPAPKAVTRIPTPAAGVRTIKHRGSWAAPRAELPIALLLATQGDTRPRKPTPAPAASTSRRATPSDLASNDSHARSAAHRPKPRRNPSPAALPVELLFGHAGGMGERKATPESAARRPRKEPEKPAATPPPLGAQSTPQGDRSPYPSPA